MDLLVRQQEDVLVKEFDTVYHLPFKARTPDASAGNLPVLVWRRPARPHFEPDRQVVALPPCDIDGDPAVVLELGGAEDLIEWS